MIEFHLDGRSRIAPLYGDFTGAEAATAGRAGGQPRPLARRDPDRIAGVAAVIRATHTDRQSTLLVRTDGPVRDPAPAVADVTLEDLVLAYLADPSAGTPPGPAAATNDRLEVQA